MHEMKKQTIVDKLAYIMNNISDPALLLTAPSPKHLLMTGGRSALLVGKAAKEYEAIPELLQSERIWKDKFSKDYLEKVVKQILGYMFNDENADKACEYLDAAIVELEEYKLEHTVYLPVDGITMAIDELELGKIVLKNMRGKLLDEHKKQTEDRILEQSASQEENEQHFNKWQHDALPILKDRPVIVYTAIGEPVKIQERAEEEWYQVARVLRYFIFLAYQKNLHIDIGLRGDIRYGIGQAVIMPSTYDAFYVRQTLKGPRSFEINQEIIDAMQQAGVFALIDMIDPHTKTAFSDTLLTGVHWVANALVQDEPANEFLSLVSCLETFLTREKADIGSIKNAIAGGVGWVLGRNQEDRLQLHREMKSIYDKRSTVSHGGEQKEIINLLPRLRDIVGAFMERMVQRREEFKDKGKKALHEWIDEGPMRQEQ